MKCLSEWRGFASPWITEFASGGNAIRSGTPSARVAIEVGHVTATKKKKRK